MTPRSPQEPSETSGVDGTTPDVVSGASGETNTRERAIPRQATVPDGELRVGDEVTVHITGRISGVVGEMLTLAYAGPDGYEWRALVVHTAAGVSLSASECGDRVELLRDVVMVCRRPSGHPMPHRDGTCQWTPREPAAKARRGHSVDAVILDEEVLRG